MRKVDIDYLTEGSELAKPVYLDSITLLGDGTQLSLQYIQKLKQLGFPAVFINDGYIDDVSADILISEETKTNAIKLLKRVFYECIKKEFIDIRVLKDIVIKLIEEVNRTRKFGLSINDVYLINDYLFNHSLNVSIISIFFGLNLNWDTNKLLNLGLGALLHDIGKMKVPLEILNKPGKLTESEYETVKKHVNHGYDILSLSANVDTVLPLIALFHHERYNGSGYPRGLKNEAISEYAKIVAIADVYDAMSSDRCFIKNKPVYEICRYLQENSRILFDPDLVDIFMSNVAIYPNGSLVMLNDGCCGFVIRQNSYNPYNPVVRVFWNCDGTEMLNPKEVDLSNEDGLSVLQVLGGHLQGVNRNLAG